LMAHARNHSHSTRRQGCSRDRRSVGQSFDASTQRRWSLEPAGVH
jgi:hypothetical protein